MASWRGVFVSWAVRVSLGQLLRGVGKQSEGRPVWLCVGHAAWK